MIRAALLLCLTVSVSAAAAETAKPLSDPGTWLPRQSADIQVIDKMNAHVTAMTLQNGQQAENGTLTIALRNCVVRPPDLPQDSAAFLDVTDRRPDAPGFHGWMFSGEPAVSMLENPIYDLHVVGCH
jgi:hypothetical protein